MRDVPPLSRERIISVAMHLVSTGASDLSMRAVAAALEVNAMALYHYFRDKQALRDAMVEQAFAPLYALHRRLAKQPTLEFRLRLLANTYLRCAVKALSLTQHLAVRGGEPLAPVFATLFDAALTDTSPRPTNAGAVRDVLVDYLHGVALAGQKHAAKALEAGWPILMAGIRPQLALNPEVEGRPT